MVVLLAILLTGATIAFILLPLFRHNFVSAETADDEKITEDRGRERRSQQKDVSTLKDADKPARSSHVDEEIEKKVAELRQGKGRFCARCGAKYQAGSLFCSKCGASLKREGDGD